MFCKWCGKEVTSDLNFCPFCGKTLKKAGAPESNIDKSAETTSQAPQVSSGAPIRTENNIKPKGRKKTKTLIIVFGSLGLLLVAAIILISLGVIEVSWFKKDTSSDEPLESSLTEDEENTAAETDDILHWPVDDLPDGVPEIEGVVFTSIESVGDKGALTIYYEECNYQEAKEYADKLAESGWELLVNEEAEGVLNVIIENNQNEIILFNWSEATSSGTIVYGFVTHIGGTSDDEEEKETVEETVDDSSPDFIIEIEDDTLKAAISFALERLGENTQDGITVEEMSKLEYLSIYNTELDVDGNSYMKNYGHFLYLTGIALDDCYFTEDPIENIEALKYAVNLKGLLINGYDISDIGPLSSLSKLEILVLHENKISDLSPLSSLENLWFLILSGNNISDISPLAGTNIEDLQISGNNITDFSPLNECKELRIVHIDEDGENDIDMIGN